MALAISGFGRVVGAFDFDDGDAGCGRFGAGGVVDAELGGGVVFGAEPAGFGGVTVPVVVGA